MRSQEIGLLLLLVLILSPAIPAAAHVPGLAGEGVVVVPDAEKSYAWYGVLDSPDDYDRYILNADAGMVLILATSSPDPGAAPPFALIGPGIGTRDPLLPRDIPVGDGYGSIMIPLPVGVQPPSYEPFTPMAIYEGGDFSYSVSTPGDYTVVVHGGEGRYILATGYREEFSVAEWLLIPVSVLSIRIWQGQSLFLVLLPIIGAVIAGGYWFRHHCRETGRRVWPGAWLIVTAGFAYAGSGILVIAQMIGAGLATGPVPSMLLTLIFAAIPIALGVLLVRVAVHAGPAPTLAGRGLLIVLAILGFISWAGLIVGPVLVLAAAIVPGNEKE